MKKIISLLFSIMFIVNILPTSAFASESVLSSENEVCELYETNELTCKVLDENGEAVPFRILNHEVLSVAPLSVDDNEITEIHTLDFVTYATNHTETTFNDDAGNHMRATLTVRYSTGYNSSGNLGYLINSVTISHSDLSGQASLSYGELNIACKGLSCPGQVRNLNYTSYNYTYITNFNGYAYKNEWKETAVGVNSVGTLVDATNGFTWTVDVDWFKI